MKYISATIRDTLLTIGIWMLVPVEVGGGQKRVSDDVLNLPKFRSWWGCSHLHSKMWMDYWDSLTNRIDGSFSSRSTMRVWEILSYV